MTINDILARIRNHNDCKVFAPSGLPNSGVGEIIPDDVLEFYRVCGGIEFFGGNSPYAPPIVAPSKFCRANPVIRKKEMKDDISFHWYICASNGNQHFTIDLAPERLGRCYDSFWDCHAVQGSQSIIAMSFTELLSGILESNGKLLYWNKPEFPAYGDAYKDV